MSRIIIDTRAVACTIVESLRTQLTTKRSKLAASIGSTHSPDSGIRASGEALLEALVKDIANSIAQAVLLCGDELPIPCTDSERTRNHELGSDKASCHTCAMTQKEESSEAPPMTIEHDAESFVWTFTADKARSFFGQDQDAPVRVAKDGPQTDDEKAKWKPTAKLFAVTITPKRRATPNSVHGTPGARVMP
jgi:hypothetical protein